MRVVEQLSVFIDKNPMTLAAVCDALASEKINIYGLAVSDTSDHAVVRLVVSDTTRALAIFESRGTLVIENEVLMIENDNKPGSFSRVAQLLASRRIEIHYAYLASMPSARKGLLILRVSDLRKAQRVLAPIFLQG